MWVCECSGEWLAQSAVTNSVVRRRQREGQASTATTARAMYHDPLVTRRALPDWLVSMPKRHAPPSPVGHCELRPFEADLSSGDEDSDAEDAACRSGARLGTYIRNSSRHGPAVSAWHGMITSQAHLEALASDAALLVQEAPASTFWLNGGSPPRCSLEALARSVYDFHSPRCGNAPLSGAEWWVQVRSSDGGQPSLGLHWDADEEHKNEVGEHLPPWIATVTYIGGRGAPTLILPALADADGRVAPVPRVGGYLSWPVPGKHLAFDGRLLHGTLHELAATSESGGEKPYVRVTILVNLWVGHRPAGPQELPAKLAERMTTAAACPVGFASAAAAVASPPSAQWWPDGSGGTESKQLMEVGYIAPRALRRAAKGVWQHLARGFPFFHPPIRVVCLPSKAPRSAGQTATQEARSSAEVLSLVHLPQVRVQRPWLEPDSGGAAEAESHLVEADDDVCAAAETAVEDALTREAAAELAREGGWRASKALRAEIPGLAAALSLPPIEPPGSDSLIASVRLPAAAASRPRRCWIGGEAALLYLACEGLEACALCVLREAEHGGAGGRLSAACLDLNTDDSDGFTALHFACNLGMRRLVDALLRHGANPEAATRDVSSLREPGGRTPLHLAAAAGQRPIAASLIAAKASVCTEDWQGASPFVLACRRGHHGLAAEMSRLSAVIGGGPAPEMPSEQELRSLDLADDIAVRHRASQRRSVEGRPRLTAPFTIDGLLDMDACASLIGMAEAVAAERGWQSARHKYYPTVDLPLHDLPAGPYAAVRELLDSSVLPEIVARYATDELRIKEAFVVKYEAASSEAADVRHGDGARQAGLDFHRDGTLLNCVVLLSQPGDFEGGGTVFAPPLDRTYKVGCGDCLCSCGQLLHGAAAVTRGTRYVLIAFIDELMRSPCDDDDDGNDDGDGSQATDEKQAGGNGEMQVDVEGETAVLDSGNTSSELTDWNLGALAYSSDDDDDDNGAGHVGGCEGGSHDDDDARCGGPPGVPLRPSEDDGTYDLERVVADARRAAPPSVPPPRAPAVEAPPEQLCAKSDPSYAVERLHFSQLSVAAFRRRCASSRTPLILTGLGEVLAPLGLTAEVLQAALPAEMALPMRGRTPMRAADFFDALRRHEPLYLADAPLAHHFPWLYQLVRVPRYFGHCFCHRTRARLSVAFDTPALFVGGAGTRSALHVDQMCSNFWMLLTEGSKHWTCFHPDDSHLLSPSFDVPEQIDRFPPLSEQRLPPCARRVDFVVHAGEVLFVPWGTPHEVINLSNTCAVSANYIDQTNVAACLAQGRAKLPHRAAGSARHSNLETLLSALDEIEWPELEDDLHPSDDEPRPPLDMGIEFEEHRRLKYSKPVTLAASSA